ncbi:MAG: hypothetical protein R3C14_40565 [Caldilineaceae bacterium]
MPAQCGPTFGDQGDAGLWIAGRWVAEGWSESGAEVQPEAAHGAAGLEEQCRAAIKLPFG